MTFIDASIFVSIMTDEDDGATWLRRLNALQAKITSGVAVWEAARAVGRIAAQDVNVAVAELSVLLDRLDVAIVPIGLAEARTAGAAHQRYGKGRHPAKLNMGDCFAYACAKTNDAKLLYKGNDFAQTDLA